MVPIHGSARDRFWSGRPLPGPPRKEGILYVFILCFCVPVLPVLGYSWCATICGRQPHIVANQGVCGLPGIFWYNVYQKIPDTDSGVHLVYQNSCILIRQDGTTKYAHFWSPSASPIPTGHETPFLLPQLFVPRVRVAGTPKMAQNGPMMFLPFSG